MLRPILALLILAVVGCSLHRIDREPAPELESPASWTLGTEEPATAEVPWWKRLEDEKLSRLTEQALDENLELTAAVARLEQADAARRKAGANRLPSVALEASASSRSGDIYFLNEQADVGATVSWELDIFNRLGATALARRMEAEARADDVRAVRLMISARVAEAYYGAVEQHQQIALLKTQIDVNEQLLEVTESRFEAGIVSALDVLQQRSELEATKALLPLAQADLRVFENQLDVLLGVPPDGTDRVSSEDGFADVSDPLAVGVPSDLLLDRPDLRSLRHQLVAADAEIGRAIAERLPRITLTGSAVYATSANFSGLATSVLGSLFQPLLEWGARKAEVERNRALYEERLAQFTQAYLDAMVEVENALYTEQQLADHLERLENRRNVLEDSVARARELYQQGLTDYLPVLNAIRDLQRVERELLSRRRQWVDTRIQLNRAVGGSTVPEEES